MRSTLFLFIIASLMAKTASGENSLASSAIVQMQSGSYCFQVNEVDVKMAGFLCKPIDRLKSMTATSSEFFEWNVFQLAAKNQILKNRCMQEQIDGLLENKKLKQLWYTQLTQAWIGAKKAQLRLGVCNREFFSQLNEADVKSSGYRAAYEKALARNAFGIRQRLTPEWIDLCSNESQIAALRSAQTLFQFALPLVSHSNFFQTMEAHRKMIINEKTGKPLSDDDIMNIDMHDLTSLNLTKNADFEKSIGKSILEIREERKSITSAIERSKSDNQYQLSSEVKDFIHDDETLFETLESRNLLGKDGSADGNPIQVSRGTKCLLSKYNKGLASELGGFAIESAILGGLFSKALKAATKSGQLVQTVSSTNKSAAMTAFSQGMTINTYQLINEQVSKSCPDPRAARRPRHASKVMSVKGGEDIMGETAADLPQDFEYLRSELPLDEKKAPSCQGIQKNFMLNTAYRTNCLKDMLAVLAPLHVSLPVIFATKGN